ncbi:hypothetical protein, unlikely [Trypanosoma brucei gambiense DAL972]|uniref:Uncharacterized protein n=1 Tax=Trypanosoma brucei gambiense (strain MHOM/CI/86/DAL972) TaxID=679716 RepID=C9ZU09_TRYB9|nr:hypothetical protein, unlikely [Trypanosoma brucei gambiense DAL972]CBH12895.1 hypothetical protein, unlikely [Trypanosoma brucei gambiense DAL972]|eukprot:XP_011775174.1 hypothetical protein, unlikely [Trypanosoma brucei gambiense DAL972]
MMVIIIITDGENVSTQRAAISVPHTFLSPFPPFFLLIPGSKGGEKQKHLTFPPFHQVLLITPQCERTRAHLQLLRPSLPPTLPLLTHNRSQKRLSERGTN